MKNTLPPINFDIPLAGNRLSVQIAGTQPIMREDMQELQSAIAFLCKQIERRIAANEKEEPA